VTTTTAAAAAVADDFSDFTEAPKVAPKTDLSALIQQSLNVASASAAPKVRALRLALIRHVCPLMQGLGCGPLVGFL
jgi:hypothetical protein